MERYSLFGFNEFILTLGYKSEIIKRYFLELSLLRSDFSVDLTTGNVAIFKSKKPNWVISFIETGNDTQTGGRLKRISNFLGDETFLLTYGDGLSDVNLSELVAFHKRHGKLATVTAVRPAARFGSLTLDGERVVEFSEKRKDRENWVNGGFFVLEPKVLEYIEGDQTPWEQAPLEKLAASGELMAYTHQGFWQSMDTLRDRRLLDAMCDAGETPWRRKG